LHTGFERGLALAKHLGARVLDAGKPVFLKGSFCVRVKFVLGLDDELGQGRTQFRGQRQLDGKSACDSMQNLCHPCHDEEH